MASTIWGIDLGTTNSCIARVDDYGRPVVVHNKEGRPTTPSVVLFTGPDEYVVGQQALRQASIDPEHVCMFVKPHMGEPDWGFLAFGHEHTAHEVSALILRTLAADASEQTDEPVEDVVIAVPAYFGMPERKATEAAGQIAGLNVVAVINEPTAAAFSYGCGQGHVSETVMVYDLGGATFDVTVIRLDGGDITVVVSDGDHRLGGADWDQALTDALATKFIARHPSSEDPREDELALIELRHHVEEAKRVLTSRASVREPINLPSGRGFVEVTREEFEAVTRPLLERTFELTRQAIENAKRRGITEIDRVLLAGGSSLMPAVKRRLGEEFGWAPELEEPDQAVAKGAALAGTSLARGMQPALNSTVIEVVQPLLEGAALITLLSQTEDVLKRYSELFARLSRVVERLRARREAGHLPDVLNKPPQTLIRFIRTRTQWDSGQLARKLDCDVPTSEALLDIAGYVADPLDGLWRRSDDAEGRLREIVTQALIDALSISHAPSPTLQDVERAVRRSVEVSASNADPTELEPPNGPGAR